MKTIQIIHSTKLENTFYSLWVGGKEVYKISYTDYNGFDHARTFIKALALDYVKGVIYTTIE